MTAEVVVGRNGRITIPAKLREKYKIEGGTRLKVIGTEEGVLFTRKLIT